MAQAPPEIGIRAHDRVDDRERDALTRCPGEGSIRAGLGVFPCVVVAQAGGEERYSLEATLQQGGFSVVAADDGVAALEMVCAAGPDAVIADLDGRDVDGLVLCQVLRSLRAHSRLPALVLTAAHGNAARARTLHGLDGVRVLRKPVRSAAVAGALSDMIGKRWPMAPSGRSLTAEQGGAADPRAPGGTHRRATRLAS